MECQSVVWRYVLERELMMLWDVVLLLVDSACFLLVKHRQLDSVQYGPSDIMCVCHFSQEGLRPCFAKFRHLLIFQDNFQLCSESYAVVGLALSSDSHYLLRQEWVFQFNTPV